jgi:hypothetical protein
MTGRWFGFWPLDGRARARLISAGGQKMDVFFFIKKHINPILNNVSSDVKSLRFFGFAAIPSKIVKLISTQKIC